MASRPEVGPRFILSTKQKGGELQIITENVEELKTRYANRFNVTWQNDGKLGYDSFSITSLLLGC